MKNILSKQVLKLLKNNYLYKYVYVFLQFLVNNNYNFYFVGGSLRDVILSILYNKKFLPQDIDIVVETKDYFGLVEKIKDLYFKNNNIEFIAHPKFLTFSIIIYEKNKKLKIDLSLPRKEQYKFSGALPEVDFGSIQEDLFRRDFTVNSIALRYDNEKKEYYFFDPYYGIRDLFDKKIRILHNKSFIDDPTRIIRAIRFAADLNFKIEKNTEKLLKEAVNSGVLKNISKVRLHNEFLYILKKGRNLSQISKNFLKYNVVSYYKDIEDIIGVFVKQSKKIELQEIRNYDIKFYIRLFYLIKSTLIEIDIFDKEYLKKVKDIMVRLYINKKDREDIYYAVKTFIGKNKVLNHEKLPLWIEYYSKIFDNPLY
ncbi:MAG: hypothetical protein NC816_01600 [Candidatus Omnitrophica bacterium]|nr:hypothetical protein [Candidatus Omnitrophota bacterium]